MQTNTPDPSPPVAPAGSTVASKPGRRRWVPILAVVVLLVVGVIGFQLLYARTKAPDVTFTSLTGERVSMQSLRGRVVMVNFWATSCVTCVKEMPQLVDTYTRYKDRGLEFYAVAMSYDPPNYVLNFTETRKLPFKVSLDSKDVLAKAFGDVTLTPTTFLIDKQGNIIKRYVGEPDFEALHKLLDKAVAAT